LTSNTDEHISIHTHVTEAELASLRNSIGPIPMGHTLPFRLAKKNKGCENIPNPKAREFIKPTEAATRRHGMTTKRI
jgi:hypothetical protein